MIWKDVPQGYKFINKNSDKPAVRTRDGYTYIDSGRHVHLKPRALTQVAMITEIVFLSDFMAYSKRQFSVVLPNIAVLGDRIIAARGYHTKESLAGAVGFTVEHITRWESGARVPSVRVLNAIANYVDCDLNWLIGVKKGVL